MKRALLLAFLLTPSVAFAGTIDGTVKVVPLTVGSVVKGPDEALVFLEDAPAGGDLPKGPFAIEQKDKQFSPKLLVVPVGATVDFPNRDAFYHNVFSDQDARDTFDLGLYKGGNSKPHTFSKPGVFPIYCNIHPRMLAWVVVVTNSFFVHPGADGKFTLGALAAGRYKMETWSPWAPVVEQEVVVPKDGSARADVLLNEKSPFGLHLTKDGKPYGAY